MDSTDYMKILVYTVAFAFFLLVMYGYSQKLINNRPKN